LSWSCGRTHHPQSCEAVQLFGVGSASLIILPHSPETFGPSRLNIPKAPALGLLLEQPHFDSYNRKVAEQNKNLINKATKAGNAAPPAPSANDDEGQREPITYDRVQEEVDAFKQAVVVSAMHEEEERDDTYAKWINLHDSQLGTDFECVVRWMWVDRC